MNSAGAASSVLMKSEAVLDLVRELLAPDRLFQHGTSHAPIGRDLPRYRGLKVPGSQLQKRGRDPRHAPRRPLAVSRYSPTERAFGSVCFNVSPSWSASWRRATNSRARRQPCQHAEPRRDRSPRRAPCSASSWRAACHESAPRLCLEAQGTLMTLIRSRNALVVLVRPEIAAIRTRWNGVVMMFWIGHRPDILGPGIGNLPPSRSAWGMQDSIGALKYL